MSPDKLLPTFLLAHPEKGEILGVAIAFELHRPPSTTSPPFLLPQQHNADEALGSPVFRRHFSSHKTPSMDLSIKSEQQESLTELIAQPPGHWSAEVRALAQGMMKELKVTGTTGTTTDPNRRV